MNSYSLLISKWLERSVAHGPGERFVLWVQGCHLACPGCFSVHTHSFRAGQRLPVPEIAKIILRTPSIEGITVSGGEPFLQAGPLAVLSKTVRDAGLSVMCYTGFTFGELRERRHAEIDRLLNNIDILVDGRYEQDLAANYRWRGSSNQRVHFLSDAYRDLEDDGNETGHVEMLIQQAGYATTGVWPPGFLEQLQTHLTRESRSP